jgi:DNA-binding transcriptional LysR family regulator
MNKSLDIAPLRSLVAVDDCGGFQRAADHLHLSQAAVSQHIRRLESVIGRPLVERHGRGSRFTADGEYLLERARQILALHDETLLRFADGAETTIVIGSTEHAAAQLLPAFSRALEAAAPDLRVRFRIDRGSRLRDGLANGRIDLALLLGHRDDPLALPVGDLDLTWYSAPGWERPAAPAPVPVVVFDKPCALRNRAFESLAESGVPAVVGAEAIQLAGVQAAVAAGLGVALMATLGEHPSGLVPRDDLPSPGSLPLLVCGRAGIDPRVALLAAEALRPLLATPIAA